MILKDSRVGPFPHDFREKVYRHYLAAIRARDDDIPVTISTESLDMWRSLGKDLGFTPANYVCGCGAGATPNRRVLDTNPWHDVKAAVDWDGRPVYAQSPCGPAAFRAEAGRPLVLRAKRKPGVATERQRKVSS